MVVRPVSEWFPRPRYGGLNLALMLSCGHVRWVRSRGQAMRLLGCQAECHHCHWVWQVTDVLDWAWITD